MIHSQIIPPENNIENQPDKTRPLQVMMFWVICIILCAFLLSVFINYSGVNNLERAKLGDMVYGSAYRPYVTRVLVPLTVRMITELIPNPIKTEWDLTLETNPITSIWLTKFQAGAGFAVEAVITLVILFISLLGFCYALRYLLTGLYHHKLLSIDLAIYAALFLLVPFFGFGYIYDFTTLFLFTLSYAFTARKNWRALAFIFPFVCLNKETAVLLILILFVYGWDQLSKPLLLKLLASFSAIFIMIKLIIDGIFRKNPGSATEFHFHDHLTILREFPLLILITALLLFGLVLVILKNWKDKPQFLRRSLVILIPMICLYMFFGFPFEFRAMYEAYPIVLALAFPTGVKNIKIRGLINPLFT